MTFLCLYAKYGAGLEPCFIQIGRPTHLKLAELSISSLNNLMRMCGVSKISEEVNGDSWCQNEKF